MHMCPIESLETRRLLANIVVDTLSDLPTDRDGSTDGLVSLREAIIAANTNAPFGDAPAGDPGLDTISFANSLAGGVVRMSGGEFEITDDLNLVGANLDTDGTAGPVRGNVFLDAGNDSRHFTVAANVDVDLSRFTLVNGQADNGGSIYNAGGMLNVSDSIFFNNAADAGGAIFTETADTQTFRVDLQTLNAAYGSTATGSATLTLSSPTETTRSLRVQIDADGLQDLTDVPGGIHVAHIHGQFLSNLGDSLADQGGGDFFSGTGGVAVNSVVPSTEADGALNVDESEQFGQDTDYLDFFEGRPKYGPVVLNLTSQQLPAAPEGVGPLTNFFALAGSGDINPAELFPAGTEFNLDTTYEFDLTNPDELRQFNNMSPLNTREIVLHGLTIPTEISDAIDAATGAAEGSPTAGVDLGDGTSFRRTAPVAAGNIVATSGVTTLNNSVLSSNSATVKGGALENTAAVVDVNSSFIVSNTAGVNGAGLHITGRGNTSVNNSAVDANVADQEGGGLWNSLDGSLYVNDTSLRGNVASGADADQGGGGLFNDGGALIVTGGSLVGNLANGAAGSGGGVLSVSGTLAIDGSTLDRNVANRAGGGIEVIDGTLTVDNATLTRNVAGPEGSASPGNGGALHITGETQATFSNSRIEANIAASEGGGLWNQAGSTLNVIDTSIRSNVALGDDADNGGGGIFNNGGTVNVDGGDLQLNLATGTSGSGGGILSTDGAFTIANAFIGRNVANRAGGGIEIIDGDMDITFTRMVENVAGPEGSASPGNGGALHVTGVATVDITNANIERNVAGSEGGGLWNQAGSTLTVRTAAINGNSALGTAEDNGGGGIFNNGGVVDLFDVSVFDNTATSSGGGVFNTTGGVVTIDDDSDIFDNAPDDLAGPGVFA